jgi:hypothetical protein
MVNRLKNCKGQGMTVQYALTFALVLAVITAMSVYFKRAVQGRFVGARDFANRMISATFRSDDHYNLFGNFALEYEPYYTERAIEIERSGTIIDRDEALGITGIQSREYDQYKTTIRVKQNQLAPKDAY